MLVRHRHIRKFDSINFIEDVDLIVFFMTYAHLFNV